MGAYSGEPSGNPTEALAVVRSPSTRVMQPRGSTTSSAASSIKRSKASSGTDPAKPERSSAVNRTGSLRTTSLPTITLV